MRTSICGCILLLFISVTAGVCHAAETIASLFPMEAGTYWIYKGRIEWTPVGKHQKVKSKTLTWQMTIHDVIESAECRVALVSGFPGDVAWYEEGMLPQYRLLAQDDKCVYLKSYQNRDEAVAAAKAIEAGIQNCISHCIMEFPLTKGKKYDVVDENRSDTWYAWYVEKIDKVNLKVKGYANQRPVKRFRLVYRTNPDHTIMEFVPGLGITRFLYQHHGTVAFEDLRLIEHGRKKLDN